MIKPMRSQNSSSQTTVSSKAPVSTEEHKKKYEIAGTEFVVDAKYEIIKQIGSGAYGVVVSAVDRRTNKKYAIKKVFDRII